MEFDMDFHKIWQEQCAATRAIRERFGVKSALDYLVGEKLLNFAKAADQAPRVCCRTPALSSSGVGWDVFNPYELTGYLASVKPSTRKKLHKLLYVSS